jgi:FSR family fosmidomycin resistance protein-like MFS transporter
MTESSARLSFWFSNLGHYFTHMFMLLYPTVVLALEHQFTMSYGELLSLSLPGFVLFGVGALPAGWLGDRWSEGGMLSVLFIGMGLSAIFTGLATSPLMIAVGLSLIGLFAAIYHPVGTSLIVRGALNRGRALGINGICGSLGVASAALVAGTLMTLVSWRAAFIVPGVVVIGVGIAFSFIVRRGHLGGARTDRKPQPEMSNREMVWTFAVLAVASSCTGLLYNGATVALPKVFSERMGALDFGGIGIGGMVSLVYLIAGGTQLVGGWLADRYPLKTVYIVSYLVQVPLLAVAAGIAGLPMLFVSALMIALQVGAVPVEGTLYARYSSSRWRGTAFGMKFVISLGVSGLAVPMVALIRDTTGNFTGLFYVMAGLALVVALVALLLPGERKLSADAPTLRTVPAQGD